MKKEINKERERLSEGSEMEKSEIVRERKGNNIIQGKKQKDMKEKSEIDIKIPKSDQLTSKIVKTASLFSKK